jgi:hypothetical protein
MVFRVVLLKNGEYKKTLYRCETRESAFKRFHLMVDENKTVKFPQKHVNSHKILPVKYQICITKPTEPTDKPRMLRDSFGKLYKEKLLGDWTILHADDYQIEETFLIYGMDGHNKADRPNIDVVAKKLFAGAYKKNITKQVIVVHNKLVVHNEESFDMVICKCLEDAQRLHHAIAKIASKQKIKSLVFQGTATPATVSIIYRVIKANTNWSWIKIRRRTTRP